MGAKKKKCTDMNITLKGGYIPLPIDNIGEHNAFVNRGAGIHKPKKGKGSYTRKEKYTTKYF